jgi:hypothetical protein
MMGATHILKEDLQNTASFLIDETGDTLDTTTAGKTTNSGLGDTLDVVTKNLPVAFSSTLSESFSTLELLRISKPREWS